MGPTVQSSSRGGVRPAWGLLGDVDLCSLGSILGVTRSWLFPQLTYRDWVQLELEMHLEVDSLSDTER